MGCHGRHVQDDLVDLSTANGVSGATRIWDTPPIRTACFPSPLPSPQGRGRTVVPPRTERIASVRRTASEAPLGGASGLPLPEGEGRGEGERPVRLDPCFRTKSGAPVRSRVDCLNCSNQMTENLYTVVLANFWPGCKTTDGKPGLLIESG